MNIPVTSGCTNSSEDAGLVAGFLAGDSSAFDHLFVKYQSYIFTLCLRLVGNREEAYDAAQDAFLRIYRSLRRFRGKSSFKTWAYSIAVCACMDLLRRRKDAVNLDEQRDSFRQTENSPDQRIDIECALNSISPNDCTILVLKYYEQLSYEEIGQVVGCTPEQAKIRLHRARNRMREVLEREDR